MKKLISLLALCCAGAIGACSSGSGDDGAKAPGEPVEQASESLTGTCTMNTFGHPCDPDGAAGPKLECEGVCWVGTNGTMACSPIADVGIATMNGRVCGTTFGTGCANSCFNGACVNTPPPAVAA